LKERLRELDLYPILHKLIKEHEKLILAVSFVVTFYFQLADYLYGYELFLLPKSGFKYYSILFFPWLFYFVLGMYTATKINKGEVKLNKLSVKSFLLWASAYCILMADTILTSTSATSIKPTIVLYSAASFFFLYLLSVHIKDINSSLNKFVKWFSAQSFFIYFSHILVLSELRIFIANKNIDAVWSASIVTILLFISVTIISCVTAYLLSLTPFARVLGGTDARTILSTSSTQKRH